MAQQMITTRITTGTARIQSTKPSILLWYTFLLVMSVVITSVMLPAAPEANEAGMGCKAQRLAVADQRAAPLVSTLTTKNPTAQALVGPGTSDVVVHAPNGRIVTSEHLWAPVCRRQ